METRFSIFKGCHKDEITLEALQRLSSKVDTFIIVKIDENVTCPPRGVLFKVDKDDKISVIEYGSRVF